MSLKPSAYNVELARSIHEPGDALIWNSLSGALCRLTSDTCALLTADEIHDKDGHPDIAALITQGLLVDSRIDEFELLCQTEAAYLTAGTSPVHAYVLAPTLKCNLSCRYCLESGIGRQDDLSPQAADSVVEFIRARASDDPTCTSIHVTWFGGEPLLRLDRIRQITESLREFCDASSYTYSANMISNGVLMTEAIAEELSSRLAVNRIQITLDGGEAASRERKGATRRQYQQALDGVAAAARHMAVTIRFNTDKDNYDDIKGLAESLLVERNLAGRITAYVAQLKSYFGLDGQQTCAFYGCGEFEPVQVDFNKYLFDELGDHASTLRALPAYRTTACPQVRPHTLVIGPHGELYHCEHQLGRAECTVGHIDSGVTDSEWGGKFASVTHQARCADCNVFPVCMGDCPEQRISVGPLTEEACEARAAYCSALMLLRYEREKAQ